MFNYRPAKTRSDWNWKIDNGVNLEKEMHLCEIISDQSSILTLEF